MTRWLVLALALSACGGKSPPPPSAAPAKDAVAAFHDILAPLWHAEEGPQRVRDTCNAVAEMQTRAQAIADARKDQASASLVQAVTELGKECGGGQAEFSEKLAAVHEAFHAVGGR